MKSWRFEKLWGPCQRAKPFEGESMISNETKASTILVFQLGSWSPALFCWEKKRIQWSAICQQFMSIRIIRSIEEPLSSVIQRLVAACREPNVTERRCSRRSVNAAGRCRNFWVRTATESRKSASRIASSVLKVVLIFCKSWICSNWTIDIHLFEKWRWSKKCQWLSVAHLPPAKRAGGHTKTKRGAPSRLMSLKIYNMYLSVKYVSHNWNLTSVAENTQLGKHIVRWCRSMLLAFRWSSDIRKKDEQRNITVGSNVHIITFHHTIWVIVFFSHNFGTWDICF